MSVEDIFDSEDTVSDEQMKADFQDIPKRTKASEFDPAIREIVEQIDWKQTGERIKAYRLVMGIAAHELASRSGLELGAIVSLENGTPRKTANYLWNIVAAENLSIKWLFQGIGKYSDNNPPELLPPSLMRDRGAGIRRNRETQDSEEGSFTDEPLEFVLAVDKYKQVHKKQFLSWTETFALVKALGYRKVAPAIINPNK